MLRHLNKLLLVRSSTGSSENNVLGSDNILARAIELKIKKEICFSTDKVANQINAPRISKALIEKAFVRKVRTVNSKNVIEEKKSSRKAY